MNYKEKTLTPYHIQVVQEDNRGGFRATLMLGDCIVHVDRQANAQSALKSIIQWMDKNHIITEGVLVTTKKWELSISHTTL